MFSELAPLHLGAEEAAAVETEEAVLAEQVETERNALRELLRDAVRARDAASTAAAGVTEEQLEQYNNDVVRRCRLT